MNEKFSRVFSQADAPPSMDGEEDVAKHLQTAVNNVISSQISEFGLNVVQMEVEGSKGFQDVFAEKD